MAKLSKQIKHWLSIIKDNLFDELHQINVNGTLRQYIIHPPNNINRSSPLQHNYPLLIAFHGAKERVHHLKRNTGFNQIANEHNFYVAYPFAINKKWNDGREEDNQAIDDIKFVKRMLSDIEKNHPIKQQKIYATGASNGGLFVQRIGCEMANQFAAIATVISTMSEYTSIHCTPARAMPVMIINSTKDKIIPWQGGQIRKNKGKILSVNGLITFWLKKNDINKTSLMIENITNGVNDNVTKYRYHNPVNQCEVILLQIHNAGHTWPSGKTWQMRFLLGKTNKDVNASLEIWKFLSKHTLKETFKPPIKQQKS